MDYRDYLCGKVDYFWYKARWDLTEVLLSKVVSKMQAENGKIRILDVGSGTGEEIKIINKFGDVYAVDINEKAVDLIPDEFCTEKKVADACKLPYEDDFFHAIISFDVLEHITEDRKAVLEAHRVLKRGGYLVYAVPCFQWLFSSHDRALGHKRRYSKSGLKSLFDCFTVARFSYWNFLLFVPSAFLRILNKSNDKDKIEYIKMPKFINQLLYLILKLENRLIALDTQLPVGTSIVGYCRK